MKVTIIQEIVDPDDIILGHLYRHLDLPFAPDHGHSIQLDDGYTCMPVHVVYDVPESRWYLIDSIQALFLNNCAFSLFVSELKDSGWRFREEIYANDESIRITI